MNTQLLINMLIKHEDLKLKPYVDSVGKLTIGVGHNLTDLGITKSQAMSILSDDLANTLAFLVAHCPWWIGLDDVRQRAIADMAFNLSSKILEFHNMIAAIEAHDWTKAHDELLNSTFAHQTGQRAQDLATMLLTGIDH